MTALPVKAIWQVKQVILHILIHFCIFWVIWGNLRCTNESSLTVFLNVFDLLPNYFKYFSRNLLSSHLANLQANVNFLGSLNGFFGARHIYTLLSLLWFKTYVLRVRFKQHPKIGRPLFCFWNKHRPYIADLKQTLSHRFQIWPNNPCERYGNSPMRTKCVKNRFSVFGNVVQIVCMKIWASRNYGIILQRICKCLPIQTKSLIIKKHYRISKTS